jgi:hypothetical protein
MTAAAFQRFTPTSAHATASVTARSSYRTIGATAAATMHHIGTGRSCRASITPYAAQMDSVTCNTCSMPISVSPSRFAISTRNVAST